MAGDGVMEFGDWMIKDALQRNPCVKVPEFPDELTCFKLDESDVSAEWRVYVPKGRKCSECRERQGYYLDAETIQRQQEHIAELERQLEAREVVDWWTDEHGDTHVVAANGQEVCHYSKGEYAEAVSKALCERDELIRDMLRDFEEQMHGPTVYPQTWYVAHKIRAQKLGIEVKP